MKSYKKTQIRMLHQLIAHYINSANAANTRGDFTAAVGWCEHALQVASELPEAWFNLGVALSGLGRKSEALDALEKARVRTLNSSDAQNSIGLQLTDLGAYAEAEICLLRSIELDPDYAFAYSNLGKLRSKQRRPEDAEAALRKAIVLQPDLAPAHLNLGAVLNDQYNYEAAEVVCRQAIQLAPHLPQAWINFGAAMNGQKRHEAAEAAFRKAIELDGKLPEAWINLGQTWINSGAAMNGQKRHEAAEAAFRKAIELDGKLPEAWINLGSALNHLKRYEEAIECFRKSLELDPDADFLFGLYLYARMKICDWSSLEHDFPLLIQKIKQGEMASAPLEVIGMTADPAVQLLAIRDYTAHLYPAQKTLGPIPKRPGHDKIRIGYYSADFRTHPVGLLAVELFETHDKSRFELIGFSFDSGENDPLTQRIAVAFDRFIDVRAQSDREVTRLSRELGIDIAINLGGHSDGSRTGIFAMRAAPIQVNYLGFPGTMGADYIDYLITDKAICPQGSQAHYTEKLAYLPHCFMPHDSTQGISSKPIARQELALPETGFVFCCFNNHHKINPGVFDVWMRLLKKVEGSVLWLSDGSQIVKDNLCKEAVARGVDPTRLVFARRLDSMAEHLARYRLADLFIDTLPYNAHTTACDALWAGVPVLTCPGESFASRVAASLLNAVGLPEMVTLNHEEYETLALELATNPERLQQLKQKLERNRLTTALFDTALLTRHIEAAYSVMNERLQNDLPTENIDVSQ